ncbi:hypothetical protein, conserved [Eimeria acervulina]|uniref:Transmembrane protein n=1 Tax=Eimeria acervulina TaxID=5801 RepID=U6GKM4_EIMAC|nr:hypothetical protein, conserved [Eimeria acervulina]CDI79144.1 hypothetical protein, conserved [Eimeria acervulina]
MGENTSSIEKVGRGVNLSSEHEQQLGALQGSVLSTASSYANVAVGHQRMVAPTPENEEVPHAVFSDHTKYRFQAQTPSALLWPILAFFLGALALASVCNSVRNSTAKLGLGVRRLASKDNEEQDDALDDLEVLCHQLGDWMPQVPSGGGERSSPSIVEHVLLGLKKYDDPPPTPFLGVTARTIKILETDYDGNESDDQASEPYPKRFKYSFDPEPYPPELTHQPMQVLNPGQHPSWAPATDSSATFPSHPPDSQQPTSSQNVQTMVPQGYAHQEGQLLPSRVALTEAEQLGTPPATSSGVAQMKWYYVASGDGCDEDDEDDDAAADDDGGGDGAGPGPSSELFEFSSGPDLEPPLTGQHQTTQLSNLQDLSGVVGNSLAEDAWLHLPEAQNPSHSQGAQAQAAELLGSTSGSFSSTTPTGSQMQWQFVDVVQDPDGTGLPLPTQSLQHLSTAELQASSVESQSETSAQLTDISNYTHQFFSSLLQRVLSSSSLGCPNCTGTHQEGSDENSATASSGTGIQQESSKEDPATASSGTGTYQEGKNDDSATASSGSGTHQEGSNDDSATASSGSGTHQEGSNKDSATASSGSGTHQEGNNQDSATASSGSATLKDLLKSKKPKQATKRSASQGEGETTVKQTFPRLPTVRCKVSIPHSSVRSPELPSHTPCYLARELLRVWRICNKRSIYQRDVERLLRQAGKLAKHAQDLMASPLKQTPTEAVDQLGRRLLLLEAMYSIKKVLGPRVQWDAWWRYFTAGIPSDYCRPLPEKHRQLSRTLHNLALELSIAVMKYKIGDAPSPEEVATLKEKLFTGETATSHFRREEWDAWRPEGQSST